ncbi:MULTISPECIES: hypothetical protein [Lactococcus]|jgi:hypothetical protein|uniref:DUF3847 domain-containing protein n=3 Tax=Lactococcus TaxID=1357 RepID=A0A7X1Z9K6_9LACT|nr:MULTISPECIES: hypothetical protein [Lactococcus]AAC56027.1 L. lactis predicted coding region ORF00003 [Lactococcus lactis]KST41372.1 hypothetical protein APG02_12295 [Lactococcus lactis subsp. lactis bv. diacetylactis]KZK41253.1 hypothetical protein B40_2072 [Lactococcus cremoris]MCT0457172.1 hypothetical protein [Lactococcus cremoris]MCT0458168.1 hypothetical protein [Lactococcus cremoris]
MSNQLENLISKKEEIQKKIERENSILKKSKYLESTKKRKERTRKLIQKGALLDKYFDTENLSIDETEDFLKIFSNYIKENKPDKYKKN